THEPQLVFFVKERLDYLVLDSALADDVATLRALEPGDLGFLGRDRADRVWLAAYTNDDGPVRYHAYDRAGRQARFLFEHQPALSEFTLAHMEPFAFTARDGLVVHGYLTFPSGRLRRALPTVLTVHGGPWARDTWG